MMKRKNPVLRTIMRVYRVCYQFVVAEDEGWVWERGRWRLKLKLRE